MPTPYTRSSGMTWFVRLQLGYDRDDMSKNALLGLRFNRMVDSDEVRDLLRRAMNDTCSAGYAYTCHNVIETLKHLRPDCQVQVIKEDLVVTDIE